MRLIEKTMPESTWQERALRKYYYNRPGWKDGTTQFHELIRMFTPSGAKILEVGAGPTNKTTAVLSTFGNVTGLDVDPAVRDNIHCQQAVVYDGVTIPFEDNSVDLAVSNYVCEHIENPIQLAREINRVLRPGGLYIFRTPNLWHYVSLIAKATPQWFHKRTANRVRNLPEESHDPYLTYHRMNTRYACRRILESSGFNIKVMKIIEAEPSYGMSSRLLFYPFMMWERLVNSSRIFECLRVNILCVATVRK